MGSGATSPRIPPGIAAELVDPSAYADGRVQDRYRWLRTHIPLGVAEPDGFDPFWVVTRHADILAVSSQNQVFHSGDRPTALSGRAFSDGLQRLNGGSPHLIRSLIEMDTPDHTKYRALTQAWFKPANLQRVEDQIRDVARAAVDALAAHDGRRDVVTALSEGYPLRIIMRILGLPDADEPLILRLSRIWRR
jgi:cytochrome P450